MSKRKIAVVLFNLGGPDSPKAIRPFLFNLFYDPAIINLPNPFRWFLAKYISGKRAPIAKEIYAHLGGKSPLLEQTEAQARALEKSLESEGEVRCFIAMRYWHPFSDQISIEVKDFDPDEIVLLPLYPQYSTTTTKSSFDEWKRVSFNHALEKPEKYLNCYPTEEGFITALAEKTKTRISEVDGENYRILFSAHGLPKDIIDKGDPYQMHVEKTCQALVEKMAIADLDWSICYQSRVGPKEWIGPSTDDEITRAGTDKKSVVLVPVAFVSEHSETLVELDIEYAEMAKKCGVPQYLRVPTVGVDPVFIEGLSGLVKQCLTRDTKTGCHQKVCPDDQKRCPIRKRGIH
ncbi:MAG: ferrochelatase [Rhodospirillales bacterium]|nr:ferrochelatase [Rhodospirillales bacterium]